MQRNLLLALALTLTTTLAASLTPRDDAASLIPRDFVHYPPFACEPNRCEVCHENCQASRIKHGYTRDWLVHTCYDKTCVNSGDCLGCCNQNKEPCPLLLRQRHSGQPESSEAKRPLLPFERD
ncbi:unnamed protein product [Zymoseptoria tritici ST99CH_3D7]|uniref:4Fe-4S ferredoxin-type domain-containing protein n=1 Tax=Zymoseptoria tritici (strain ST99CH_3D7) TaxID=1276538 RepID=A0A1X7RN05_ZYMT9|nr:unnamed protein product [Zymoseptoria tritici ST99CH_3D7]